MTHRAVLSRANQSSRSARFSPHLLHFLHAPPAILHCFPPLLVLPAHLVDLSPPVLLLLLTELLGLPLRLENFRDLALALPLVELARDPDLVLTRLRNC